MKSGLRAVFRTTDFHGVTSLECKPLLILEAVNQYSVRRAVHYTLYIHAHQYSYRIEKDYLSIICPVCCRDSFLSIFVQGSEWDFGVFSGIEGVEKPDPRIYEIALKRAGNIKPEEVLHIGDSMRKDYVPATSIGMHGLLLDRFKTSDAEEWRKSGAVVLPDLEAAKEWITSEKSAR